MPITKLIFVTGKLGDKLGRKVGVSYNILQDNITINYSNVFI